MNKFAFKSCIYMTEGTKNDFLQVLCVTESALDGFVILVHLFRLTPVHSVSCGESTNITISGAELASPGGTEKAVAGVAYLEV